MVTLEGSHELASVSTESLRYCAKRNRVSSSAIDRIRKFCPSLFRNAFVEGIDLPAVLMTLDERGVTKELVRAPQGE